MSKAKGTKGERELIKLFWSVGWAAIRSAGSGSQSFPSPDLLVGNKSRVLAIESKVTKEDRKYFKNDEIRQLINFSSFFGAECWLAIKFSNNPWVFFSPEDLIKSKSSFIATAKLSELKGLSFSQLVGEF